MAAFESLKDDVFWLPSKFEDALLVDKENTPVVMKGFVKRDAEMEKPTSLCFPTEFPYEFDSFDSALSCPVESVNGPTETENTSDEEDFLAGLTRRLTQSSTQKLAVPGLTKDKLESWVMAGSPESTLSGIGSWSVSSNGSPNGSSSPPSTPFGEQNDTWDLISAAAGQVARLKMSHGGVKYDVNNSHGGGLIAAPMTTPSPVHVIKSPNSGSDSSKSGNYSPAQTIQYQMLRPHNGGLNSVMRGRQQVRSTWSTQPQPQQIQSKARSVVYENARCGRSVVLSQAAWPPLQVQQHQHQQPQHSASAMKPVFLGGSAGVKRECAGTGVFLPRRYVNNPCDSRKKSGCSTLLLSAKAAQGLNLSVEDINGNNAHSHHRFNTALGLHYDAVMARGTELLTLQKQRSIRPEAAPLNHEVHLPQEWTY
ncbi:uncharacterized protein LOC123192383 [Mangifera indica]|uniref:uncharacterized protein LOC123192383 n=1 Tax=Mangifera indica TaxID=29780 RepID=UPI001CFB397A|nr:uncharacterized protein LOC123192383 [Mangifera indica]